MPEHPERRAVSRDKATRALLFSLPYSVGLSSAQMRRITEKAVFDLGLSAPPRAMPIARGGQLRIGWISSDFRAHSIARNVLPIISRMAGIHFLYSDVKRPDNFTEEFRKRADFWHDVQGLADSDVAQLIRADQVNVLVVLAGRFDGNRPFLAAQRTAPIQISMHDVATSGLPNMDYFVADRSIVPADQRQDFTERVIRLPSFYVHDPLDAEPAVSSLPAPPVVFSCFNNPEKITREMAPVWSTILDRVPGSILRLKYRDAYNPPVVRREIAKVLPADRVVFLSQSPNTGEHLKDYAGVHIALDTTPFSGSTTTFEALWMGVPVVTLAGETPPGRWGTSMLRVLKLDDLIAQTTDQYIEIAVALANDAARLARLRNSLRPALIGSPMCDSALRSRQLERLFRFLIKRASI